jgi:LmbE family N-acetylglucosaminyl deacetylase
VKQVAFAVVSPHRDDAALSLGSLLRRLGRRHVRFRILNCFTVSDFAPYHSGLTTEQVTRLRRREDRCFGRLLGRSVSWRSLHGVDAPLRRGADVDIFRAPFDVTESNALARRIEAAAGADLLLVPLAIGRHIDHLVARRAAGSLRSTHAIAFFEDIPYAGTTAETDIRQTIDDAAAETKRILKPLTIASRNAVAEKDAIARIYRSQIAAEELEEVERAARRLGGERLWADDVAFARLTALLGGA